VKVLANEACKVCEIKHNPEINDSFTQTIRIFVALYKPRISNR